MNKSMIPVEATLPEEKFAAFSEEIKSTILADLQRPSASGIVAGAPKAGGFAFVAADYPLRAGPSEIVEELKALEKETAKYEETVCPYFRFNCENIVNYNEFLGRFYSNKVHHIQVCGMACICCCI
ncbi:hypothetical protein [Desulfuromonas versatilis]|uniref:hypothetical protein n=1 Tax=Desulfuromonas versatilis TaxID=2802975 RepID=UPI001C861676|nr:hypothetical protein [Desulfuromonas versatilis]